MKRNVKPYKTPPLEVRLTPTSGDSYLDLLINDSLRSIALASCIINHVEIDSNVDWVSSDGTDGPSCCHGTGDLTLDAPLLGG